MEDLKNFIINLGIEKPSKRKEEIISKLQEINKKFLTEYMIQIKEDKKDLNILNIIPIETEIYYYNEKQKDIFEDKMIHKNDLQKNNFGKLYFHRIKNRNMEWGKKQKDPIDLKSCGIDVCLSANPNYYLSILIRSAFINGIEKENLYSGINNICKEIIRFYNPTKCLQCFFKELETYNDLLYKRNENEQIKIFKQPRISGKEYSKKTRELELNCLNLGENYKYLNYIIETKQTFYNVPKNIQRIKNCFENKKN